MTEHLEPIDISWSIASFEGPSYESGLTKIVFKTCIGPKFFHCTSRKVHAISIECNIEGCNGPAVLNSKTDAMWINDNQYRFGQTALQNAQIQNTTMILGPFSFDLYINQETKFDIYMQCEQKTVQGITIRVWTQRIEKTTISSAISNLLALTKQRTQMSEQLATLQEQIKQIDKKIECAAFYIECISKTRNEECKQTAAKLETIEKILQEK